MRKRRPLPWDRYLSAYLAGPSPHGIGSQTSPDAALLPSYTAHVQGRAAHQQRDLGECAESHVPPPGKPLLETTHLDGHPPECPYDIMPVTDN